MGASSAPVRYGSSTGQLVVRHGDLAAVRAVHDRDRAAPVALTAQQPVPQTEVDGPLADALGAQQRDGRRDPLDLVGDAVERRRVHVRAVAGGRDAGLGRVALPRHVDDAADRQVVRAGEVEVALVVRRHRHHRARAVVRQDVVGGPHLHGLAGQRVGRVDAQENTGLGTVGRLPLDLRRLLGALEVRLERGPLLVADELGGQLRVGRHHHERRAVQGVGARGEDAHGLLAAVDGERHPRTLGAADPVALHRQHALGPLALELLHVVEQPLGVVGDLEVPLRQLTLRHDGTAPLAEPLHDLLVGEHGLVVGAPVDERGLAVRQPALEQAQEQPLRPAVVLRVGGVQTTRPVEAHAVAADGLGLRLDVVVRVRRGVLVALDRGVLGGQAEGVPADRVQHVVALEPPVAGHHVVQREDLAVPHVQVTRRVREHRQRVAALTARIGPVGVVRAKLVPHRAPLVLGRADVVRRRFRVLGAHLGLLRMSLVRLRTQNSPSCRGAAALTGWSSARLDKELAVHEAHVSARRAGLVRTATGARARGPPAPPGGPPRRPGAAGPPTG